VPEQGLALPSREMKKVTINVLEVGFLDHFSGKKKDQEEISSK
jgi:hypothetical protein